MRVHHEFRTGLDRRNHYVVSIPPLSVDRRWTKNQRSHVIDEDDVDDTCHYADGKLLGSVGQHSPRGLQIGQRFSEILGLSDIERPTHFVTDRTERPSIIGVNVHISGWARSRGIQTIHEVRRRFAP